MAALSGLSISALRFYDAADVLTPAVVEPASGYRRYRPDQLRTARLIARLRRAGLPVPAIRAVVRSPAAAGPILDRHLVQLELELAEARRQLSIARSEITMEDRPMLTLHLPAADLRTGLLDVRFAVSEDPELPMLGGVLFEVTADRLRLVATDRYRMALASLAVTGGSAEPAELLLPVELVDRLIVGLAGQDGDVSVSSDAGLARFTVAGKEISGSELALDFPNFRSWTSQADTEPVPIDVPVLRAALAVAPAITKLRESDGVSYPLSVLTVSPDGVQVAWDGDRFASVEDRVASVEDRFASAGGRGASTEDCGLGPRQLAVGVNREFLLQAVDAGGPGQLLLDLDGPVQPLTIRSAADDSRFSLLMPVRA